MIVITYIVEEDTQNYIFVLQLKYLYIIKGKAVP